MNQLFKPGDRVIYVPKHAEGNMSHRDCEHGTVTSTGENCVFVMLADSQEVWT